jgi:ferric-dicitrate binding protein FerR (iron transport regulator)
MTDARTPNEGDELTRQLQEAEQAQADADAAAQRAAQARTVAEAAQRRDQERRAERRRAWAQGIVDTYDADLAAAAAAIREHSERFADLAGNDLPAAIAAYQAWNEASLRHYALQERVATVAPELGLRATAGEQLTPPPLSEALDAAIALHLDVVAQRIRDEMAAEFEGVPAR